MAFSNFFSASKVSKRSSTGSFIYLNSDHLGSASVTTDASGNNAQHQEFDPWGKVRSGSFISQTSISYTGQRLDDGTGLLYYNARYYDPLLGRFLSADTIIPNPTNPQALNRYAYSLNNPLRYRDPSGHRNQETEDDEGGGGEPAGNFPSNGTGTLRNEYAAGEALNNTPKVPSPEPSLVANEPTVKANGPVETEGDATPAAPPNTTTLKAPVIEAANEPVISSGNIQQSGNNIALGIDKHLDKFANEVGRTTWKQWAKENPNDWKNAFMNQVTNPENKVSFNLTDVQPWPGITRAAAGGGGATDWELYQIYQHQDWWDRITFYDKGEVVPNPFK